MSQIATALRHDIEPSYEPTTHPLSPSYDDSDQREIDAIKVELRNRDDEVFSLTTSDEAASEMVQEFITDVLAGRGHDPETVRAFRQRLDELIDAEAPERLKARRKLGIA